MSSFLDGSDHGPSTPGHDPALSRPAIPLQLTIDQAIDRLQKGRFQRRILAAAGMCNGVNAMAVMVLSFIRPAITVEYNISVERASWLSSSVFFGILAGTLVFGPLGDHVGRKPIFLLSATITAALSLASSYAPSFEALVLLRFGVGIGVGGTVIPFDTLAELTPSQFRGSFLLYLGYFWTVGTSATPLIAMYAMQEKESWRLFLLLASIPAFVSTIFGVLWVPESPRWLVTKGRNDEALQILRLGAKRNGDDADQYYPPGTNIITTEEEALENELMSSLTSLFLPQWRKMVICMLIVWTFLDFIYWGCIQISVLVFAEFEVAGDGSFIFEEGEQYDYDYSAILSSSLAEIFGQTAVLLLIDRWGRVPTQALAYACGAFAIFALCLVSYLEDQGTVTERIVLVLLAFVSRAFIMGATSLTWVHTAEMLPTQIRNSAHAIADALAGSGGALQPWLVSPHNSMLMIGVVMGCITLLTASLVWLLPETRGIALGTAISRSGSSVDTSESKSIIKGDDSDDEGDRTTTTEIS